MKLPDYEPILVPEGHYKFQISKEPEVRKTNNKPWIIFHFKISNELGETRKFSNVFLPGEPRYRDLLIALGAELDEKGIPHLSDTEIIGKTFEADIIHEPDYKDSSTIRDRVANIKISDNDVPPPSKSDDEVPF